MRIETVVCGSRRFADMVTLHHPGGSEPTCFEKGAACRDYLKALRLDAMVLVGPDVEDVSSINLVAALCLDAHQGGHMRQVVLFTEGPVTGSLASRAHAAGAAEVVALPRGGVVGQCDVPAMVTDERVEDYLEEPGVASRMMTPMVSASPMAAGGRQVSGPAALRGQADARNALLEQEQHQQEAGHPGFVIVLASGSGGVGKTTLAVLTALSLADRGLHCALMDGDLQFGVISYLLGLTRFHTLDECVISVGEGQMTPSALAPFASSIQGGVDFYASPRKPELGDIVTPRVEHLIGALCDSHDVVVVDTGSFWGDALVSIMRMSDLCLLVCNQHIASVQSCSRVLELIGRLGVPRVRACCVLNRFDTRIPVLPNDVQPLLRGLPVHALADGGREVEELMGVGCPEELFALRNSLAVGLEEVLGQVLEPFGLLDGEVGQRRLIPEAKRISGLEQVRGR
ncbi:MAG: P-loop NTPase [Coriobacteriales bacterium]|nr:P-loop NTPase [Coriobacteriales bacterium]